MEHGKKFISDVGPEQHSQQSDVDDRTIPGSTSMNLFEPAIEVAVAIHGNTRGYTLLLSSHAAGSELQQRHFHGYAEVIRQLGERTCLSVRPDSTRSLCVLRCEFASLPCLRRATPALE